MRPVYFLFLGVGWGIICNYFDLPLWIGFVMALMTVIFIRLITDDIE